MWWNLHCKIRNEEKDRKRTRRTKGGVKKKVNKMNSLKFLNIVDECIAIFAAYSAYVIIKESLKSSEDVLRHAMREERREMNKLISEQRRNDSDNEEDEE